LNAGDLNVLKVLGHYVKPYLLQRNINERNINDYSPALLSVANSNIDVQFCSDARDTGKNIRDYVTSYAAKSDAKATQNLLGINYFRERPSVQIFLF
jgi:hypothetical protein